MSPDEARCLRLCLNGQPDAYRILVERYHGPLLAYLAGRVGNFDRAEDIAQESLVRGFFRLNTLREAHSFFPWLIGIADRVAKEQAKAAKRHQLAVTKAQRSTPSETDSGDLDVQRAIARLPAPQQEVILLRYYGGLSCAEIAEQLGVALTTVTKRLSRAYAALREQLRDDPGNDDLSGARS
jgi:RNA polymerase sigma-70 factor (ECF subfamily)